MEKPIENPKIITKNSTTINTFHQNYHLEEQKYQTNLNKDEDKDFGRYNSLFSSDEDENMKYNIFFNIFNNSPHKLYDSSEIYDGDHQNFKMFQNDDFQNNETQLFNGQGIINLEEKEKEKEKNLKQLYFGFPMDNPQNYEIKNDNNQAIIIPKEKEIKKEKNVKLIGKKKNKRNIRYKLKNNIDKKHINNIKLFIINKEKEIKVGNNIKKKSKRKSNQFNMIKRNLIQDIIRNWINYGKKDNNISKLDRTVLVNDFKKEILKDIYSQKITKKEEATHNISIINKAEGMQKIKLHLLFKDVVKLFFDNYKENELVQKIQQLKANNKVNDNINCKEFLEGLQKSEEYYKKKGGSKKYATKLKDTLNNFKKKYIE